MMEHKFRAWDKKWKRWIEPEDICIYGDGTADFIRRGENGDKIEMVELKRGEIELIEFTGLLDKACREIYEGDIVKMYPGFGCEWEPRICIIEWETASFWLRFGGQAWILDDHDCQLEIIGNRFEHPGLLTPPEGREG